jgi:hypothetical protein
MFYINIVISVLVLHFFIIITTVHFTVILLYFDNYVLQVGVEFFLDILNHHEEIKGSFRLAFKGIVPVKG